LASTQFSFYRSVLDRHKQRRKFCWPYLPKIFYGRCYSEQGYDHAQNIGRFGNTVYFGEGRNLLFVDKNIECTGTIPYLGIKGTGTKESAFAPDPFF
jgi:hypothetical protein